MKIISVVGARPNFMKIAPFINAIRKHNVNTGNEAIEHLLVHTGQHYDERMSKVFFESLGIPEADIHLGIGSGSHAEQVGNTMIAFEKVLREERPDWVVVVGDVNATLACAVTAKKEHIRVCHIEAGLRSGDMDMPEEINRLVTDRLSDLLLTPDRLSNENLRKEGVPEEKIRFVGNIMIDTLEANRQKAAALDVGTIIRDNLLESRTELPDKVESFSILTMHRPSNVDRKEVLEPIIDFLLDEVCAREVLIWPIHPRTRKQLERFGLWDRVTAEPNLILLHPVNYYEMLKLNMEANTMLTDSGGLQEECCVLGTPCMTLRWNTERPITLREHGGASILVGNAVDKIRRAYKELSQSTRKPQRPELWDGQTAQRCLDALLEAQG
ncbi:non-hydrolyzing UDP-N-acetylglucosamine 2-epimerase [Nitratifractor salsuginis]|uniref:UDP-N-acetylglucosamine 2-epimerase n=1 Tax=Nitratifractor salsuginis (strain DSM 16511 / JCM 12458 / E9I37-1) TaxID=749222 RepID=E6X197_NITSE|nr:UDP-N-acetylglucosamine 2-epimerase (non-hydrolyzing) [Nitratifractor salsuginis]ADV46959.1 UDP-N-acetylglucosamine 2-epimerase [Nitratifractor salsuginis DSM 16511]